MFSVVRVVSRPGLMRCSFYFVLEEEFLVKAAPAAVHPDSALTTKFDLQGPHPLYHRDD